MADLPCPQKQISRRVPEVLTLDPCGWLTHVCHRYMMATADIALAFFAPMEIKLPKKDLCRLQVSPTSPWKLGAQFETAFGIERKLCWYGIEFCG